MKCGLLSDSSTTSNGFGWHLTAIPERLSGCMLGVAIMPVLKHYGNHCHQPTINAPFVTLIFVSAYEQVLPQNRHRAVGEESGKANHIERFNLTLMPGHGACRACCSTYSRLSNQIIVLGELISEATFLCRGFQTIAGRSSRNLN